MTILTICFIILFTISTATYGLGDAVFDADSGQLYIPNVSINGTKYAVLLMQTGELDFTVTQATPLDGSPDEQNASAIPAAKADYTNSLGMSFNLIPGGSFTMGNLSPTSYWLNADETKHEAIISESFFLMTTEVTQDQWLQVTGSTPSKFSHCGGNCPVEQVSWNDIQNFLVLLNSMEKGSYRLPTETEWEYGARAGSNTSLANGELSVSDHYSCYFDQNLNSIGWYCNNSGTDYLDCYDISGYGGAECAGTHPVAQKQANNWGLYDMHGNVTEWCQDNYAPYPSTTEIDPQGPSTSLYRIHRGGDWAAFPWYSRSAYRGKHQPDHQNHALGFRLVYTP